MTTKIGFGHLVAVMMLFIASSTSTSALNSQIDQFPEFLEINLNTGGQLSSLTSQSHVAWLQAVSARHEARQMCTTLSSTVLSQTSAVTIPQNVH